ncbi:SOSS complex subunit C homolog B [Anopheles nili]|uniref:SOSS complex subunit C homolog B n=1 Tax=Anopheles nili TaxID=185578 RepID=UPI00237B7DA6|nr:SOSS complex subunit C homolog B [Anopheles nili]
MQLKNTSLMAFPSSANQDVTKKILEDIQMKKQLLQKGVNSHTPSFGSLYTSSPGFGSLYTPSSLFQLPKYASNTGQSNETNQSISKGVWSQAINQSFGFFVPQDSLFGNNILPVLPRYDNPSIHYTSVPKF